VASSFFSTSPLRNPALIAQKLDYKKLTPQQLKKKRLAEWKKAHPVKKSAVMSSSV